MDGVAKVIGGERVAIQDSHAYGAEGHFVGALLGEVEDDGAFAVVNILVGVAGSAPVAPAVRFIAAERAADEGGTFDGHGAAADADVIVDQEIGGSGVVNLIEALGAQGLFDVGADGQAERFVIDAGIAFNVFAATIVVNVVARYYGPAAVIFSAVFPVVERDARPRWRVWGWLRCDHGRRRRVRRSRRRKGRKLRRRRVTAGNFSW